jgi:outer membrane protein assembly factor BamB
MLPPAAQSGNHAVGESGDATAPLALDGDDWPAFRHDTQRTGNNVNQTAITKSNVATLMPKWTKTTHGVFANPLIVNGIIYQADLGGFVYAWSLTTGSQLWSYANGTNNNNKFEDTPALYQNTLFVGDLGNANSTPSAFRAINASNGRLMWSYVDKNYAFSSWQASPVINNGLVYEGEATNNEPFSIGGAGGCDPNHQVVAFSPFSPTIVSSLNLTPAPLQGADVWGSVVLDPSGNMYTATGNLCGAEGHGDKYANAIMKITKGAPQMGVGWSFESHACPAYGGCDQDFGGSPTYINAGGVPMILTGGKDGNFYALNANTGALIWQTPVGIIEAASATDGTKVYVPVLSNVVNAGCSAGQANCGSLVALNLSDGSVAWKISVTGDQNGFGIMSSPTISQGMVFAAYANPSTMAPTIWALDSTSGATLWSYAADGDVYGSAIIVNGGLFVGDFDGGMSYWRFTPGGV